MRNNLIIIAILIIVVLIYFNRSKVINVTRKITMNNPVFPGSNFDWWELVQTNKPYPNIPNEKEERNLVLFTKKILQPVRNIFGPTSLSSVFRSKLVNDAVGGEDDSQHRLGFAGDIVKTGNTPLREAFEIIKNSSIPYDQLIYETGTRENKNTEWIHISYNPNGGRRQALLAPFNYKEDKRDYINVSVT